MASGIGMLFVVLVIILVLGIFAGLLARVCGGRRAVGEYDFEGWVEKKCSSCIDGSLPPPPPAPAAPPPAPAPPATDIEAGGAKKDDAKPAEEKKADAPASAEPAKKENK